MRCLFQSLFYWEGGLNGDIATYLQTIAVFQSLFYWRGGLNKGKAHRSQTAFWVSILVLLEGGAKRPADYI